MPENTDRDVVTFRCPSCERQMAVVESTALATAMRLDVPSWTPCRFCLEGR